MMRRWSLRHVRPVMVCALALATMPASAQYFYERPFGPYPYNAPPPAFPPFDRAPIGRAAPLTPSAIVDRLEDLGYDDVGRPRSNGEAYVVEATSPRGRRVTLVVDPFRGAILDRMAPGDPRSREEAEGWDGRTSPRSAMRPPGRLSPLDEMPEAGASARPRRDAARPAARAPSPSDEAPLRAPADARVAPDPEAERRAFEGREDGSASGARKPREAARSDPDGRTYGTNPGGAPIPARKKPAEQARVPSPAADPGAAPKPLQEPTRAAPQAVEVKPRGPVRVIGGVTPLNSSPAPAPVPAPSVPAPAIPETSAPAAPE